MWVPGQLVYRPQSSPNQHVDPCSITSHICTRSDYSKSSARFSSLGPPLAKASVHSWKSLLFFIAATAAPAFINETSFLAGQPCFCPALATTVLRFCCSPN